jgi:hypothetical protein
MVDLELDAAPPREVASPTGSSSLVAFFTLTFLASWAWWIVISPLAPPSLPLQIRELLVLPGVFAPAIVAICLTARANGRAGVRDLLSGMFRWDVRAKWYVFAVGYVATAKLFAAVGYRLIRGEWPVFGLEPWYLLLAAVAFSTPSQAGEEIGWRGYALPRLASRCGLGLGSMVLGVLWAAWHLPFFYLAGNDKSGQAFLPYLLGVTALSVVLAGLFWRTRGSLLLTMIMHSAANNTKDIVPSAAPKPGEPILLHATLVAWLSIVVLWAGAIAFLAWMARDGRAAVAEAEPSSGRR